MSKTLAILSLAFALRIAAAIWWQVRLPIDQPFFFGDSHGYWELARSIAHSEAYAYGPDNLQIFRTPGYPLLLTPLFWLWHEPPVIAGRILSALCGTAAVALTMLLAKRLFNPQVATIAGFLAAIDPGCISQGVFVLSEAPFTPVLLLNLPALISLQGASDFQQQVYYSLWTGFLAALATLIRPSWLLFLPFILLLGLLPKTASRKPKTLALLTLAAFCLTLFPWWLRNYLVAGRLVPTTLQVGASLYDGLNPQATGASDMRFVEDFAQQERVNKSRDFEVRMDQRMYRTALDWARQHPENVLQLALTKICRMWTPWPNASDVGGFWVKLALAVGYVPIMILCLRTLFRERRRSELWLLILPAIYFTLLHVIFVASIRYRQPAMFPLIVLAAASCTFRRDA